MTESELKGLIEELVFEDFDASTKEGLLPINVNENEVQALFELKVNAIQAMILNNPHLKEKLPTSTKAEIEGFIRRISEEADRMTRDKIGLPYRQ